MALWKSPPKAKIYEALTALSDGRVRLVGNEQAEVLSSDRKKTYLVEWSEDLLRFSSNDNASYWQGYMGYPILAVLMLLGRLEIDNEVARLLSGVRWKDLNQKFRNDYEKAIEFALETSGADTEAQRLISSEVDRIMVRIEAMSLEKLPRRRRPAKS